VKVSRLGLVALALLHSVAASPGQGERIDGYGGFPLSEQVTALWLNGAATKGRPQPVIMVYYRGAAGWHDRGWTIDGKWNTEGKASDAPSFIRLGSPDLDLSIECGGPDGGAKVQGKRVDLSKANVYLAAPVGDKGQETVVLALGKIRFEVPEEANPAVHVLDSHPDIAAQVLK
jgi:hypothetical protein